MLSEPFRLGLGNIILVGYASARGGGQDPSLGSPQHSNPVDSRAGGELDASHTPGAKGARCQGNTIFANEQDQSTAVPVPLLSILLPLYPFDASAVGEYLIFGRTGSEYCA